MDFLVGELNGADGTAPQQSRGTRLRELAVNMCAPIRREATYRGRLFSFSTALTGVTLAAGMVAPAGGATTLLSLFNPPDSGFYASITRAWLLHISGTPGAGLWAWFGAGGNSITAAQNAVVGNGKVGGAATGLKHYANAALTGSTVQAQIRPFPGGSFAGAIAATSPGQLQIDEVDGAIEVGPAGVLSLTPPAAGTSHVVAAGIEYQLVPA